MTIEKLKKKKLAPFFWLVWLQIAGDEVTSEQPSKQKVTLIV